nr:hypothetical protein [Tanacetum cinerariifolium]
MEENSSLVKDRGSSKPERVKLIDFVAPSTSAVYQNSLRCLQSLVEFGEDLKAFLGFSLKFWIRFPFMSSVSSDSDGPSWGISLMDAGELSEIDPYEEVAQQGQAPPLSPAYVPDPMELDEHVPVYVPEPEHLKYHVPSDDDMQVEDQPYADDASPIAESPRNIADSESMEEDSIDYPNEPEDDDEDLEEDHTDYPADGGDDDDEPSDDDEMMMILMMRMISPLRTRMITRRRRSTSLRPTLLRPAYDQAPLGHRAAIIRMKDDIPEEDMPHRRRFVLTASPPGGDVAETSAAAARLPREDVGYVRALHASEHMMMTSIEEVNLRISYRHRFADRRRLSAEDLVVRQMMRIYALVARAWIDTMDDTDNSC